MRTFLKLIILVPIALVAVAFAFANRTGVTVSFDPFATDLPAFALTGPLFVVLLITVAVGVVLGGVGSWIGQGRHRRALRATRRENKALSADVSRLRADLNAATERPDSPGLPALLERRAA